MVDNFICLISRAPRKNKAHKNVNKMKRMEKFAAKTLIKLNFSHLVQRENQKKISRKVCDCI